MEHKEKIPCTVYIMTLNSGPDFKRTLESLKEFGEILVCDGNSTDGTQEMARSFGARVIPQSDSVEPNKKITDFATVHNKCRVEAHYDWIFQLDHDEVMPPETAEEIRNIISDPNHYLIYQVPNKIVYKGKIVEYSSTYPGYELRFFNRLSGAVYKRNPHSRIMFDQKRYPVGYMKNHFLSFDQGEPDMGWKYIAMEIRDSRLQTWPEFFYWSLYRRLRSMGIIITKSVLIRLRHPGSYLLPLKYDFYRLGHAWFVLSGVLKERLFGYNSNSNLNVKKILLISQRVSIFYQPVLQALKSLGFYVEIIDPKGSVLLQPGGFIHKIALRSGKTIWVGLEKNAYQRIDRKIIRVAEKLKPDYVFALKSKSISVSTLEYLRSLSTTINWYPDTMDNWESIKRISPHYDYFFCYDRFIVEKLKKELSLENVYHLPFAADIDRYASWPEEERIYPISFLGSYHPERYPERLVFLNSIKDLGLHLWGNKAWAATSVSQNYLGPVSPNLSHVMEIYRKSKIVIHMDLMTEIWQGTGVTLRPFDVTASGALLVAHTGRVELGEMFQSGKEFIPFTTAQELRNVVEYYLHHDREREQIAQAGFEKTRNQHTYIDRMHTVFSIALNKKHDTTQ